MESKERNELKVYRKIVVCDCICICVLSVQLLQ